MTSIVKCHFCSGGPSAKYQCPRCNASYCGLSCYQSESHRQCSEAFYKDCVKEELSLNGDNEKHALRKTLDILQRANNDDDQPEELDSDDDDDLSARLDNIDLEDPSQVWAVLTAEERRDFKAKLESGELHRLVPDEEKDSDLFWWELYFPQRKIEDMDSSLPSLHKNLPVMSCLSPSAINTKQSSALVRNNLVNILCAYALIYRQLSWHRMKGPEDKIEAGHEFVSLLFNLSSNLSENESFNSAELAIGSIESKAKQNREVQGEWIHLCRSDVSNLFRGPGEGHGKSTYLLAALSDLKAIMIDVCRHYQKNQVFTRKKCAAAEKKVDFFICWVHQHNSQLY